MNELILALGAAIVVSLISLLGVIFISIKEKTLNKFIFLLVGLAAGVLIGDAFIHLIPEAVEEIDAGIAFLLLLIGFSGFFFVERVLHWNHCHNHGDCEVHTFSYMSLIGDGIHNFIDGLIIAASFIVSIPLGFLTSLAVIAHEIPQEISDFSILIYGGFSKKKALFFNFLSALTAVLGVLVGFVLSSSVENFVMYLLPIAAGGFIYIGASDLVPELHKEKDLKKSILSFGFFILGIVIMYLFKIYLG